MIGLLVRIPLALMIALPIAWACSLLSAGDGEDLLANTLEDLRKAFPSDTARRAASGRAAAGAGVVLDRIPDLGEGRSRVLKAGIIASFLHLEAARSLLPATALLVLAGLCSGLALRERLRDQAGYASPTGSGLAQIAVGVGIFWFVLYSGSPIPVSPAWLYGSSIVTSFGGALYTANLPLRL